MKRINDNNSNTNSNQKNNNIKELILIFVFLFSSVRSKRELKKSFLLHIKNWKYIIISSAYGFVSPLCRLKYFLPCKTLTATTCGAFGFVDDEGHLEVSVTNASISSLFLKVAL